MSLQFSGLPGGQGWSSSKVIGATNLGSQESSRCNMVVPERGKPTIMTGLISVCQNHTKNYDLNYISQNDIPTY